MKIELIFLLFKLVSTLRCHVGKRERGRQPLLRRNPCKYTFLSISGVNSQKEYGHLYRLGRTLWLFLGLAWLSTVIAAKQNTIQEFINKEEKRLKSHEHQKALVSLNWPTYPGENQNRSLVAGLITSFVQLDFLLVFFSLKSLFCCFYFSARVKQFVNKKVLLRKRKRHTARRVASTRYADLSPVWGGVPHPVLNGDYPI